MPTTVIPRVETVEALNFGDFSIYPDSQGRYSIHREQIRALLLQLSGESKAHAEVKAANVKLNEENAALRKQIAGLTPVVTSGSYMQDAAEAFAAAKKDGR